MTTIAVEKLINRHVAARGLDRRLTNLASSGIVGLSS